MVNPNDNHLHQLLTSVTCKQLLNRETQLVPYPTTFVPPSAPICLDAELTVQEACAALAKHRISSAPVYSSEDGGFLGMLDYQDLISYVLAVLHKTPREDRTFDAEMEVKDVVKRAIMSGHGNVPVKLLSNISLKNPLVTVDADAPILDAVNEFVRAKVHRVVVLQKATDEQKPLFVGILSQSTVAAYMALKLGKLSVERSPELTWPNGDKSIQELGLVQGSSEIISVTPDDAVIEALYKMHEHHISSVAILSRTDNEFWGSISMTDIKEILGKKEGWSQLLQPAKKFFINLRDIQSMENFGRDAMPLYTVAPTTSLISAIEKMVATHTHRVWIADPSSQANRKIVGVLSLSNVMQRIIQN